MARWALLAAALASVGCSQVDTCTVTHAISEDRDDAGARCGTLLLSDAADTDTAMQLAERCLLAAQDAGQSFDVAFDVLDGDGGTHTTGFVGHAGEVDEFQYEFEVLDSMRDISKQDCIGIAPVANCVPTRGVSCLQCLTGDFDAHQLCN